MSEHPSTHAARGVRRPVTLRTKLIAGIVGLIVVLSAVIGVVTEVFLGNYLLQQLDNAVGFRDPFHIDGNNGGAGGGSLTAGPGASNQADTSGLIPSGAPTRFTYPETFTCSAGLGSTENLGPRGQNDTISATVENGLITSAILREKAGGCIDLSSSEAAGLADVTPNAAKATVTVAGYGDFRVLATTSQESPARTYVIGVSLAELQSTQVRLAVILAEVAGGAVLVGGLVVFLIVRRSVRPLERVAATARKVSTLPLDKGEVDLSVRVPDRDTDTRTEIGQVGAALNQMLRHVSGALESRHASETRVRQFVADASHELRTPLAAIRGYAELARRGEHDPGAVSHALRRVESESSRMTTLVEDLLLLARLDSGRPLAREEVDLTMLVVDRVSDARVAGPEHRWRLDLPEEPVTIVGDSARLHQVLANLLANARNHTPPGTVVVTGLAVERDEVILTVTDDGPGIPPELQPEIFGRFVRGDSSRSRAAGSTGLGLAIVAAVITAHGGTVTIDSRPGRTLATVRLPRTPTAPLPETNEPASLTTV